MMQYGQGMVRPGAWSVDGLMLRAAVDDLRAPVPEMWSKAAIETAEQSAFWTAYARTPIGFVDHHDDD